MIEENAGRLLVSSPMLMSNARALLEAGCAFLRPGELIIDLSGVSEADSSAIVVMLGWLRAAANLRSTLVFSGIPGGVRALAELYGVNELLPQA